MDRRTTDDALRIEEGSLYPALYRMQAKKWISAAWGKSEAGNRIKLYSLTTKGRGQLKVQTAQWTACVVAMHKVLHAT